MVVKQDSKTKGNPKQKKSRQLSFKEKKELEVLPLQIENLEKEQALLHEKIADPGFYQQPENDVTAATQRLTTLEKELEGVYERWSELDAIASA